MESMLIAVKNFLLIIENNWTTITVIAAAGFLIYKKVRAFAEKEETEQIAFAKELVCKTILKYVSEAEREYSEWVKAGATKRAQVISKIYADFPILNAVKDQDGLIEWIDEIIKEALKEMREMVSENN